MYRRRREGAQADNIKSIHARGALRSAFLFVAVTDRQCMVVAVRW
jgi:hypothetical protein